MEQHGMVVVTTAKPLSSSLVCGPNPCTRDLFL